MHLNRAAFCPSANYRADSDSDMPQEQNHGEGQALLKCATPHMICGLFDITLNFPMESLRLTGWSAKQATLTTSLGAAKLNASLCVLACAPSIRGIS